MRDELRSFLDGADREPMPRRQMLRIVGAAAVGAPLATALGQGRCRLRFGTPGCDTTAIKPVFGPTGWKTVSLDHIVFRVADYRKEAAFHHALMGWTLRSDDGKQAVMDIGDWGSVVLKQADPGSFSDTTGRGGGRGGAASRAVVEGFSFGVEPWDAKRMEGALRGRGLSPLADNDGHGFESFHVKDPDGFDLQISNGASRARRQVAATATLDAPAPFEPTGWKTVWLDHISFSVSNYKESASFYTNLLGWQPTYDEGSQNECLIGDVGDIIIRGGNPLDPAFGRGGGRGGRVDSTASTPARRARIDHISFGVQPWDTDAVKDALEKRGLRARVDTSTGDEIHVAAYKSYHTTTPNGFDLQISAVTHDTRLTLPTAVTPKRNPG
jgi:catechol 2,3-dioxygenase-like lactoylglutathione lyase family enzyme